MRRINRKKLDNKGFTLIELLAVVVILAIVLGLVINSGVLGSVDNSKRTLFLSTTQKNAVVLNSWVAEDSLVMDAKEKKLGQEGFNKLFSSDLLLEPSCLYLYNTKFFRNNKFKFSTGLYHEDFGLTPLVLVTAKSVASVNFYGYYYVQAIDSITRNNNYNKGSVKKVQTA